MKFLSRILTMALMAALIAGCLAGCCCSIPISLLTQDAEISTHPSKNEIPDYETPDFELPDSNMPSYEEPDYDQPGQLETRPVLPSPEPEDGVIHVYTLVPYDWETPGCWAWLNATQENAYDQWPGASMQWNGEFYETTAPSWVDYVIINGAAGALQTEDIYIEPGYDVWVIIDANGEYYTLFYYEPTSSELSDMGY